MSDRRDYMDEDAIRDRLGLRPQRSTEEHGPGHVEAPGENVGHQRVGEPGPDYPESHSEPPAEEVHPGGDAESAHAASEGYRATPPEAHGSRDARHEVAHDEIHVSASEGTHADDHGTHAEGHGETRLGPIDKAMWTAGLVGTAAGGAIAFLFYLATT